MVVLCVNTSLVLMSVLNVLLLIVKVLVEDETVPIPTSLTAEILLLLMVIPDPAVTTEPSAAKS